MKFIIPLAIAVALSVSACEVKTPAGPPGPAGAPGAPGAAVVVEKDKPAKDTVVVVPVPDKK